ncbi:MAG: TonB-dependent receptor [Elusimicrobiota bacterium]
MVIETAARAPRELSDVAASVEVVTGRQLKAFPGASIDEKLSYLVPGIDSSRLGADISDRSPAITMRGFGIGTQGGRGQGRTLILLDGVPINNSANGSVNWNDLEIENIDRIEVVKGPSSALYGSNALAGVVNIITRPADKSRGLSFSYGSYNTLDAQVRAGAGAGKFSIEASGKILESDGYFKALPADRTIYSRKSWSNEKGAAVRTSLDLGDYGFLRGDISRYDGAAGMGTNYRGTARGEYRESGTDLARISWSGKSGNGGWSASVYSQNTHQSREEGVSPSKLTNISVERIDKGFMSSVYRSFYGLSSTFGFDFRRGEVDGYDDYLNGKYAVDKGKIDNYSPFVQLEKKFFSDRLSLTAGARYDCVKFHDGYAVNTNAPGFFSGNLKERSWKRTTGKISAVYEYSFSVSQYVSLAEGFRSAELENIVLTLVKGSGSNRWYQKPNPDLGPEKTRTAETGFRLNPALGLYSEPSFYFTAAKDFIYQIYTGVNDPSYGKEKMYTNIAGAQIYGMELPVKYISGGFTLSASYARSSSKIISAPGLSIKGKQLTYAPRHIYSAAITEKIGSFSASADWKHKSRQFTNDDNSASVSGYSITGVSVQHVLSRGITALVRIDNVFNERFQNSESELAAGRTVIASVKMEF